ncbi:ABC transporter permease [Thermicanus aegyptius]|uniref:ABC transporter permease n=1 Tax=Thermicanus aegyptius TaxID=94009 RepID=UPI00048A964D|nr:ABC transporter permease [Thermicanus aegyptius]
MNLPWYILRRLLMLIPQLLGISIVTFILVRMLPGNPATLILGPTATKDAVAALSAKMGLDQPVWIQYVFYLRNLFKGDLGMSWYTTNPVLSDLLSRAPATLELITVAMLLAICIAVPLGVVAARRPGGIVDRFVSCYSLLGGAMADFWFGLLLIFFFFFKLHLAPAPLGRFPPDQLPPMFITGSYLVDSLLTLNWTGLRSAFSQLALPALTLALVNAGIILKHTRSTMGEVLLSKYINYANLMGLRPRQITWAALRNTLAPVVTIIGVLYTYLLGGAVLVESIFSWGGIGQYAVQSVINSDYAAVQGFVLVSASFTLLVNLIVDLLYLAIDPRISY